VAEYVESDVAAKLKARGEYPGVRDLKSLATAKLEATPKSGARKPKASAKRQARNPKARKLRARDDGARNAGRMELRARQTEARNPRANEPEPKARDNDQRNVRGAPGCFGARGPRTSRLGEQRETGAEERSSGGEETNSEGGGK
jgi:hypothetical protein